MAKHPKPEEIVARLRQQDALISQDQSVADAIRAIGVNAVTSYCWRPDVGSGSADEEPGDGECLAP